MIAIKNFKMPKSCMDCPIWYDMMMCPIVDINVYRNPVKADVFNERMEECPLIEIYTKEGEEHD